MNRPLFLDEDDFPLAQVGNLVMSPARREPIATAMSPAIAQQIALGMNRQAREERPRISDAAWLAVH